MEERGLWRDIIISKYSSQRNLDDSKESSNESKWWMDLRSICRNGELGKWFNENLSWKIGTVNKIKFWDDIWVGECKL